MSSELQIVIKETSALNCSEPNTTNSSNLVAESNETVQICGQSENEKDRACTDNDSIKEEKEMKIDLDQKQDVKDTTDTSDMSKSDEEQYKKSSTCSEFRNVPITKWEKKEIQGLQKKKIIIFLTVKEINRWMKNENSQFNGAKILQWKASTWQVKVENGVARAQIQKSLEALKKEFAMLQHDDHKDKKKCEQDGDVVMDEREQDNPTRKQSDENKAIEVKESDEKCTHNDKTLQKTSRPLPKATGSDRGIVGLQNLGNTCYLNAAIQVIYLVCITNTNLNFFFFGALSNAKKCLLQVRPLAKMQWRPRPKEGTIGKEWIDLVSK
ncbi:hypothetical protein RFI_34392, partial [Reticulomyxa filosa]